MSGDNGKIEPEKTQEVLDKERTERFTKEPFSFIEVSELICGAIRNPKSQIGISILVGNCKRSELNNAQIELTHRMELARRAMDIEADMTHPKIIPAKGSMLNFARRR
jgi:hypothetical protein